MALPRYWYRVMCLFILRCQAVEKLPIEDFAREPEISDGQMSPDGKSLAFLRDHNGRRKLHVSEIGSNQITRLDIGVAGLVENAPKDVAGFHWVSNHRLLVTTTVWDSFYGVLAVERDGSHEVPISGNEGDKIDYQRGSSFFHEVIFKFYDKEQNVLMLDRHQGSLGKFNRPDILKVATDQGLAKTVLKNPGEVAQWGLDFDGVARLGILTHGELSGAIYREDERTPWRTILPLENRSGQIKPAGFDAGGQRLLVTALNREKRWTVFPMDLVTGALGEPLLSDPEYDIVPGRSIESSLGIPLVSTIFSPSKKSLVGIRYYTESLRVKWFDKEFVSYQFAVDKSLPDTTNLLADMSQDGKRMLWYAFSDQNPGAYYLFDLEKRSFRLVASRMSWLKPAQMAPMLSVKYTARDGLLIHGYLTVPVGQQPKNLPLVVMPHGGPWARDVWGFDPLVQLLANRDYAVLQMNYRGSLGYGEELYQKARQQIGGQIQDDIEDATRWAISAGVADPKRVAIMGMSYGGYSTLFALGRNPELYRCGISIAGVTDWPAIYDEHRGDSDYREANKFWRREIGDPDKDRQRLESISPINFAASISAPLLIIQGKEDKTVPSDQAKRMIAALEKVGHTPQSLFLSEVGHIYGHERKRIEIYQRVIAFLETNLGLGVQ
jgi:dipeptidyl aminopeptidase/acylaminoacyl peptidase